MSQVSQTEAACLLETGALYRTRVGLLPPQGRADLIFIGLKRGAFSIYFGDAPIYHFDLEGRWQRTFMGPTHFLKSLDTTVRAIDRVREGANLVLRRRVLEDAEVSELDRQIREIAHRINDEHAAGRLVRQEPPAGKALPLTDDQIHELLTRTASWDDDAWTGHLERCRATYGPLPFLPPDSQNAVVLQATRGEARGTSFGLVHASEHSIRSPAEFRQHVLDVANLLGRRLLQSKVAFLAGRDVLRLPADDIIAYLEIVRGHFGVDSDGPGSRPHHADSSEAEVPGLEGIHVFLDEFSLPRPDRKALGEFRERGLMRVALGVESGDPFIRQILGKSWADDDLRTMVADLKACDLGVSLLTLVGAGGTGLADTHVEKTVELVRSLALGDGDLVFLLDENELAAEGLGASDTDDLSGEAWSAQQARLRSALKSLRERGVKVLPYSLEKQWA